MIRVGVIGLGRVGMLHLMNSLKIKGASVVAAADASKSALAKARSLGVKRLFEDYRKLLNSSSDMDAVIISLPNYLHFESVKLALEEGFNVFVEKPLALTLEESGEIVKLVRESGRKLMVGHCLRFLEVIRKMKESLDKGVIGRLEVATLEEVINGPFAHPRTPTPVSEWWFDPRKSGGGALFDIGYHMIDLFRFFAGDADVVFASLDYKFNLPVEDGAILILRSKEGSVKGIINVGWYQQTIFPRYNFRVILHGNAGFLSSDHLVPHNLYLHAAKEGFKNLLRKVAGRRIRYLSYTYYYEPFYQELEHFFNCIKKDLDPMVSVEDGLKTVELIRQAYTLADNNSCKE